MIWSSCQFDRVLCWRLVPAFSTIMDTGPYNGVQTRSHEASIREDSSVGKERELKNHTENNIM